MRPSIRYGSEHCPKPSMCVTADGQWPDPVTPGWWDGLMNPAMWSASFWVSAIGYFLSGILLLVVGTCLICTARNRILQSDGIEEGSCATCCISCCPCSAPCATCQMMRHEGFHEDGYNMCHPTGKDLELGTTPEV